MSHVGDANIVCFACWFVRICSAICGVGLICSTNWFTYWFNRLVWKIGPKTLESLLDHLSFWYQICWVSHGNFYAEICCRGLWRRHHFCVWSFCWRRRSFPLHQASPSLLFLPRRPMSPRTVLGMLFRSRRTWVLLLFVVVRVSPNSGCPSPLFAKLLITFCQLSRTGSSVTQTEAHTPSFLAWPI